MMEAAIEARELRYIYEDGTAPSEPETSSSSSASKSPASSRKK